MSGDIADGLGGVVEGALLGGAVESEQGITSSGIGQGGGQGLECRNCGAALGGGAFCQNCGQKVHIHRTLSAIGHDLMHGVLHLDGKFWSTLPLLVFKPGRLTRRYIEGERAKFVSPMAMFLFSVFAMFAVFQMVGLSAPTDFEGDTRAIVAEMVDNETNAVKTKIASIDEELARTDLDDARRLALETQRNTLERDLALLEGRGENLTRFLASGEAGFLDDLDAQGQLRIDEAKERLANMQEGSAEHTDLAAEISSAERSITELRKLEDQARATLPYVDDSDGELAFNGTGVDWLDTLVKKWRSNPSLMLYKLQANGYKFSWLLIPLSIPFVWLLFAWKRRFHAYDHAIFVTYSLSFMSLLFITASLLAFIPEVEWIAALLIGLVPPIHVYKQLRGTYEIGRFSAFWRLMMLSIFIWIVLILFLQALLVLGAF